MPCCQPLSSLRSPATCCRLQLAKQQQDKAADAAAKKKRGEAAKAKAADAARAKAVAVADGAEHSGEMDGRMLSALITGECHAVPAAPAAAAVACCAMMRLRRSASGCLLAWRGVQPACITNRPLPPTKPLPSTCCLLPAGVRRAFPYVPADEVEPLIEAHAGGWACSPGFW